MGAEKKKQKETPELGASIRAWIFKRYGFYGLGVIALAALGLYVWTNWSDVREMPGISAALDWIFEEPVPRASVNRFSILVANLDNDPEGDLKDTIIEDLKEFDGVETLSLDRVIALKGANPDKMEADGHILARGYLTESGCTVVIWGTVIKSGGKVVPKLYWSTGREAPEIHGRYSSANDPNLRLPELFWNDLKKVLWLVVSSHEFELDQNNPAAAVTRLTSYAASVEQLLTYAKWDPLALGQTRRLLANAQTMTGTLANDKAMIWKAVASYRQALQEIGDPAEFDHSQARLGLANALMVAGARYGDSKALEESAENFADLVSRGVFADQSFYRRTALVGNATVNLTLSEVGPVDRRLARRLAAGASAIGAIRSMEGDHDPALIKLLASAKLVYISANVASNDLPDIERAWQMAEGMELPSQQSDPVLWAMSTIGRNMARLAKGMVTENPALVREGLAGYDSVAGVLKKADWPNEWAIVALQSGGARLYLGSIETDDGKAVILLQEARTAFQNAQSVLSEAASPIYWEMIELSVADTLLEEGIRQKDAAMLEQAEATYLRLAGNTIRSAAPVMLELARADVFLALAELESQPADMRQAHAQTAASIYRRILDTGIQQLPYPAEEIAGELARAQELAGIAAPTQESSAQ